ncbi:MAG: hypothetical protein U0Q16_36520 [Bryobacteraceae bacterium]
MQASPRLPPVAFEALYVRLRQQGFAVGVDQQIQLETLVDRLDVEGISPEHLKTLLCPVFAANPAQQKAFYEIFDETYPLICPPAKASDAFENGFAGLAKPFAEPLTRPWVYALAVLLALAGLFWVLKPSATPPATTSGGIPDPGNGPATPPPLVDTRTASFSIDPAKLARLDPGGHLRAIQWTGAAAPLFAAGALWLYWAMRRRAAFQKSSGLLPPNFWPLKLEAMGSRVFAASEVRRLAMLMRRRQDGHGGILDIAGTIAETMRNAGFPRWVLRAVRRAPEYVVLIERQSVNDHFAAMVTDLMQMLKDEGVYLARYYFTGDPRHLVSESGEDLAFADLAGRRHGDRLLVFGRSSTFLHPSRGHVEDWALPILEQFPLRALLADDGCPRRRLDRLQEAGLCVVPASMEGIATAIRFLDGGGTGAGRPFPGFAALPAAPIEMVDGADPLARWIRACSIYPELHWNLTLQLGAAAGEDLSEAGVSRLSRMSWFRRGEIPPPQREELAESIPPSDQSGLRQSLISALQSRMENDAWQNLEQTLRVYLPEKRRWWQSAVEPPSDAHDFVFLRFLGWREPGTAAVVQNRPSQWFRKNAFSAAAALTVVLLGLMQPWRDRAMGETRVSGTAVDEYGRPVAGVELALGAERRISDAGGRFDFGSAFRTADQLPLEIRTLYWPRGVGFDPSGGVIARVGRVRRTDGSLVVFGTRPAEGGFRVEFEGAWREMIVSASDKTVRRFTSDQFDYRAPIQTKPGIQYTVSIDGINAGSWVSAAAGVPSIERFVSEWVVNPDTKPGALIDIAKLTYEIRDATEARVETPHRQIPLSLPAGSIGVEPEQWYKLVAGNGVREVTKQIGLSSKDAGIKKPRIVRFDVVPNRIKAGEEAKLVWEVRDARGLHLFVPGTGEVTLRPDGSRPGTVSGERMVRPQRGAVYGLRGEMFLSAEVPVNVIEETKLPEVTLKVEPAEIVAGETVKVSWSAPGADFIQIIGMTSSRPGTAGANSYPAEGSQDQAPSQDSRYDLSAQYGKTTITRSARVRVRPRDPKPPEITFTAEPAEITAGQTAKLSWTAPGAERVYLLQGERLLFGSSDEKSRTGERVVRPDRDTVYTFGAAIVDQKSEKSVTVKVLPQKKPEIAFSVTPAAVTAGGSVNVTWSVPEGKRASIDLRSASVVSNK